MNMHSLWQRLVSLDLWLEKYRLPIFLVALVVLLRIPTFFEPYWYGDEAIYLVLGESLNRGRVLYAEIIDHKTPLIYVFAQVGTQLHFRVLMLAWLVVATAAMIKISKKLFTYTASWVLTTLTFITFISLPTFEGTIPNGELFVIGFVLIGVLLLLESAFWAGTQRKIRPLVDYPLLLLAGVSFGLAILTKVPAVLDMAAWLCIGVLTQFPRVRSVFSDFRTKIKPAVILIMIIGVGALIPIALSILYFVLIGHGQAYLDYGLLYNFRYAGTWQPSFSHAIFSAIFTLPGKTILLALGVGSTWLLSAKIPKFWTIGLIWFWCALFASLLSNRPYPHYFLQVLPPLALLFGGVAETILTTSKTSKAIVYSTLLTVLLSVLGVGVLLDVHPYPTLSYYKNWYTYISGQQSLGEYNLWFNPLMDDNYKAAKLIREQGNGELFIWGTNPVLYALSDTIPSGRFTVSFHIHDFAAYDETMEEITQNKPPFIVRMYDERGELPGLKQLLHAEYRLYRSYSHYELWKRNATK